MMDFPELLMTIAVRVPESGPRGGSYSTSVRHRYNPDVSQEEHKSHAPTAVGCFVLTVSDTRTEATDTGGQAIRDLLESAGHVVTGRAIVRDDPDAVAGAVTRQLSTRARR